MKNRKPSFKHLPASKVSCTNYKSSKHNSFLLIRGRVTKIQAKFWSQIEQTVICTSKDSLCTGASWCISMMLCQHALVLIDSNTSKRLCRLGTLERLWYSNRSISGDIRRNCWYIVFLESIRSNLLQQSSCLCRQPPPNWSIFKRISKKKLLNSQMK